MQVSLLAENFHEMLEWDFGSKILEFLLVHQKERRAMATLKGKRQTWKEWTESKRRRAESGQVCGRAINVGRFHRLGSRIWDSLSFSRVSVYCCLPHFP